MNRNLISLLAFLFASTALADPMDDYITKMRRVVEKDGRCEFAVASFQRTTSKLKMGISAIPTEVQCIGDVTFGEGTLKERSGCSAFFLDLDTGTTREFSGKYSFGDDGLRIADGKKCDKGGFEELLKLNIFYPSMKDDGKADSVAGQWSVKNWILVLGGGPTSDFEKRIVYVKRGLIERTTNKKTAYEEWFDKEKPLAEQKLAKPTKRSVAGQSK